MKKIFFHPVAKIVTDAIFTIIFGIISNAYVISFTVEGSVDLGKTLKSPCLAWIIIIFIIWAIFKYVSYTEEVSVEKFKDKNYKKAFLDKHRLEAAAKRIQEKISKGELDDEITNMVNNNL